MIDITEIEKQVNSIKKNHQKTRIISESFFKNLEEDDREKAASKTLHKTSTEAFNSENPIDKYAKSYTIKSRAKSTDGGPGSGNFGHEGVPGQVGGSAPSGVSYDLGKRVSPAAQKIYNTAVKNEKKITADMQSLTSDMGASLYGLEFSIKQPDSVRDKIKRKKKQARKSNTETSDEQILDSMGDLVRYTVLGEHDDLVGTTRKTISSLEEKGYNVVKLENKYLDPSSAYKGIHLDVVSPDGQKFELQVHSNESIDVKEKIHPLYEKYRKTTTPKRKKAELGKKMSDISSTLKMPKGIEELTDM